MCLGWRARSWGKLWNKAMVKLNLREKVATKERQKQLMQ